MKNNFNDREYYASAETCRNRWFEYVETEEDLPENHRFRKPNPIVTSQNNRNRRR